MNLQYEQITAYHTTTSEFDRWTEDWLGRNYEYQSSEEVYEQSDEYHIDGKLMDYELQYIQEWMNGQHHGFIAGAILNYACSEGIIPPGLYIIKTDQDG